MSNAAWPRIAGHGLTIGGKHTWRDWSLISASIPSIALPEPKLVMQDIPGLDGAIDLSSVLTGNVPLGRRSGELEFIRRPDAAWPEAKAEIAAHLAGRRLNAVLDDETSYYYTGRWWLKAFEPTRTRTVVVIAYDLDTYKYPVGGSSGAADWLWDDLFDTTIYYGTFAVSGSKTRTLINPGAVPVMPTVTCSAAMAVTIGGTTYNLPQGTTDTPGFSLPPGDTVAVFTGTGTVTLDYLLGRAL